MSKRTATAALQGVAPGMYRTALYSADEDGNGIGAAKSHHMRVRAGLSGTFTTSHAGSVGDVRPDHHDALIRAAQLAPGEAEAMRLEWQGIGRVEIAARLSLTLTATDRRLSRARRKVRESTEAAESLGGRHAR